MKKGKTPDFRVFKDAEFVLYSEAKHSQEDTWLEDLMAEAPPPAIVGGGVRHDPAFNKLGGHIYQAAKQFLAVNPNGDYPNVLVLTSSEKGCTFADLISTITGNFYAESGAVDPIYKSVSEGRIKDVKHTIDLYVFKDEYPGGKPYEHIFYNNGSKHYHRLSELLGSDPAKHRLVPAS